MGLRRDRACGTVEPMGTSAQQLDPRTTKEREVADRRRALGAGPDDIVPNPGPQTAFLASPADEILYGGRAGGGKTLALLLAALRGVEHPGYRAIIFRRAGPQLTKFLIPIARELYPRLYPRGALRWNATDRRFSFPSGATVEFGACDKERHIERYQGFEFAFIGWDELTAFTRYQYTFMFGRLRTTVPGLRTRMAGMTNPGGDGHEWVLRRWAAWLYPPGHPEYDGSRAHPGEILSFRSIPDSDEEQIVPLGARGAITRTFFPASLADTPQIGPDYEEKNLANLDRLTRKRLKDGDWMAREVAGEFFERGWFELVDAAPHDVAFRIRYWDLAGTAAGKAAVERVDGGPVALLYVGRGALH